MWLLLISWKAIFLQRIIAIIPIIIIIFSPFRNLNFSATFFADNLVGIDILYIFVDKCTLLMDSLIIK